MREEGEVRNFSSKAGFGFITPDWGSGFDVFLHADQLKQAGIETVSRGQRVSYILSKDKRGRDRATAIKVL
jgi:cold shock protein